ncbi:efflux RND transporter periplasmic adaptor subunit [Paracoccus tegillarcae]|uniref:Efflux RND transporter periplasmic adaptor subunit n=1 Tax=Paracoccus tegillarcae TaxID=1529068 RepID=A0A2K9ESI5_9RHOB|nr:efflux RND transporter periplasmic adaptor subunit [Paracoccus tegillarcae]AUH33786.1 efflux RND transporter periplasmic adaptor subunit [Paracoccus tegillarcae]
MNSRQHITRLAGALCLAAAMALPAAAFQLPWQKDEAPAPAGPPRPVVTEVVSDSDIKARSVPGLVVARQQVTLGFQTLGRLVARHVELGDDVVTGDVLAELDPDDLADNVRAASASLDAAEVQLSTSQATAERTRALARRNVASTAQLEQAEQALATAEASVGQARSELIRAEDAEGFARMAAPFDGVVSAVYANPGAVLTAGEQVLQLSAREAREAVIDLPDAALSELGDGAVFTVWQDDDPATETRATVDRIDPLADSATRTRRVHLSLDDGAHLRLGSLIRARVAGETEIAMTLPLQAVFDRDGLDHVWRVQRQGDQAVVELVHVVLGASLLGRAFVNSGLQQGDEVVIRGVNSLSEGQAVGERVAP